MLVRSAPFPKTLDSIQALRAIAALLVTLFHLYIKMGQIHIPPSVFGYFKAGFGGVDLFFVISGFVITHTNASKIATPRYLLPYFKKRLVRIYAIYWLVFLLASVGLLGLHAFAPSLQWIAYSFEPFTTLKALFLVPAHESILPVTWTLSYELYFYILFGLMILSPFLLIIPALVLAATVLSGLARWTGLAFFPEFPFHDFLFSPFNLEFCFGVVGYLALRRYRFSIPPVLTVVALLVFFLAGNFIDPADTWLRIGGLGLPALVLLLSLVNLELSGRFQYPDWVLKLGDASYLLYLIHIPVIMVVTHILLMKHHSELVILGNVVVLVGMSWFSWQLHRWVEKPVLNWIYAYRYRIFGFSYRAVVLAQLRVRIPKQSDDHKMISH
ncbi:peptidoglycan/LPS O-acetylase OafA/YrhL [Larkinella arboricola]|uniref:Peptidoglycan/LPS O-acetylase OafA/YrhL n=1 Tax=Larkinella arboricola TaxID=643671 RepID=A0A327XBQ7_LARAB|nr:acyltransferase [Larkinella arboricola]RAK03062.1 peptidoglycan/LPS O-acetylase OafA/YrhL [Larkinella arboricola]